jgi:glucose-6-phosphate isomerase/transaldolase/glucose-6-phosphate isomerase
MFFAPSSIDKSEKNNILIKFLEKNPTIWTDNPDNQNKILKRLGWLDVRQNWPSWLDICKDFIENIIKRKIKNIVLFGMGGSSLCPIVLKEIFGVKESYPEFYIVDTIDPFEVEKIKELNPVETFIIIASKSGTTIEPNAKFNYFWDYYVSVFNQDAKDHFGVITDPGSKLEKLAIDRGFPFIFLNPSDIGGRYSALSLFGLVPAAALGIDIDLFLKKADDIINNCCLEKEWSKNSGAVLAEFLSEYSIKNRDKLTILADDKIKPFGLWLEQLIAESTGKETRGIVPVIESSTGIPGYYGSERIFVYLRLKDTPKEQTFDDFINELRVAHFPVYEIFLNDIYDIAGQFFLWEFATALCGVFLGVNPFDEPNVTLSKNKTNDVLEDLSKNGNFDIEFITDPSSQLNFRTSKMMSLSKSGLFRSLREIFQVLPQWGYLGFLTFLPYNSEIDEIINDMRDLSKRERGFATVMGYGSRYLHSTGQLFKGGPISSAFLIFTRAINKNKNYDLIPDFNINFWQLQLAQAIGDFEAMSELNKRVIHIHLPEDYLQGLKTFSAVYSRAIMIV